MPIVGGQFDEIVATIQRGITNGTRASKAVNVINVRVMKVGPAAGIYGKNIIELGPRFFDHMGSKTPYALHLEDEMTYLLARPDFKRKQIKGELPLDAHFIDFPAPKKSR